MEIKKLLEKYNKEFNERFIESKYAERIKEFIFSTYTKDLLQSDRETFRNRISNVLSQKYEGVPRIDEKLERAIMYCLSDEYDDTPKSSLSDIIKELNK